MGERPEDVPSLEELGSDDPLPNYWTKKTTITVDRWVKASLDEHRDGRPWNQYLEKLRREHADPITFTDVEQIADELKNQLSMLADPGVAVTENDVARMMEKLRELEHGRVSYDDVRAAAREGAREAIEELQR